VHETAWPGCRRVFVHTPAVEAAQVTCPRALAVASIATRGELRLGTDAVIVAIAPVSGCSEDGCAVRGHFSGTADALTLCSQTSMRIRYCVVLMRTRGLVSNHKVESRQKLRWEACPAVDHQISAPKGRKASRPITSCMHRTPALYGVQDHKALRGISQPHVKPAARAILAMVLYRAVIAALPCHLHSVFGACKQTIVFQGGGCRARASRLRRQQAVPVAAIISAVHILTS
jgi:hypothetical protein